MKRIASGRLNGTPSGALPSPTYPRHGLVVAWKHSRASLVEQKDLESIEKDRGAEQGDVDGPLEASVVLADIACQARRRIHDV